MTKRPNDPAGAPADGGDSAERRPPGRRRLIGAAGRFGIGAAIGAGLVARSAVRGGADFILALNAGRVRVMGAPSAVCMLPIHDSNAFVAEFARREILGRVDVPVLFGASTFDPRADIPALVRQIGAWGFDGVINFPTVVLLDPEAGAGMARYGLGWRREIELIAAAHGAGLLAAAYVRTVEQAADMADAGGDLICVNFGWTAGGFAGEPATQDIAGAAAEARALFQQVRRRRAKVLCFVEGGPISTPQAAAEVCQASNADGYVASSTVDRIPLESAVFDAAAAFKAVAGLTRKVEALKNEMLGDGRRFGLIGRSAAMAQLVRMIERLVDSDLTVLIHGPSGAGKELVAQALHQGSHRRDRPLVAVNCAAIPRDLLESELFGFERGAFTGASRARLGRFEEANGGTLFLDEIGDLDLSLQGKLLRVLESGVVERLGSNQPHRLNARVLCATHRDLRTLSGDGRFREDLFFRLSQLEIRVPSLAERIEDIPLLAHSFLSTFAARNNGRPKVIDNAACQLLMNHPWPGNVRELRNVVQQAAILTDGEVIGAADLTPLLDARAQGRAPAKLSPTGSPLAKTGTVEPAASAAETERDWILDALRRNRFRRGAAARDLGLSRRTLYNKIRQHGIE